MRDNICQCGYKGNEWLQLNANAYGETIVFLKAGASKKIDNGENIVVNEANKFIVCPQCGNIKADINSFSVSVKPCLKKQIQTAMEKTAAEIFEGGFAKSDSDKDKDLFNVKEGGDNK